jgi:hypothetical protein
LLPTDDRTGDHPREPTISVGFSTLGDRKPELTTLLFMGEAGDFEKNVRLRHQAMT